MKRRETLVALAAFTLLTLICTWPLARGLTRDLPGDLVDPVLNAWIIASDVDHIAGAPADYWHPRIFAPHPLALAYSEHLTPQALQVLPIHLLTGNPILSYNLLFLSTFVLSAFGMFLFVRDLTGSRAAAFLAGVAFGFAPYRIAQIPHLQVLSSAWMPFTLFCLRRFFETRKVAPLAWSAVAWIAQNLSCGYYLLFFSPIVIAYMLWEISARGLWKDVSAVSRLAIMTAAVAAVTTPFLWPYLELRQLGFAPRSIAEALEFRADVYGFFTASSMLALWGRIARAFPASEGELFPGLIVTLLASLAIADAWRHPRDGVEPATRLARALGWLFTAAVAISVGLLLGGSIRIPASRPMLRITELWRTVAVTSGLGMLVLIISARARARLKRLALSPAGFFAAATIFAALMALGPDIYARGRLVDTAAPYELFYRFVPGFDGLRVPARFGMIVALGLAILGGLGAAALLRRRHGMRLVAAASLLIVVESWSAPILINYNDTAYKQSGLAPLPGALALGADARPVYNFVSTLPAASVVLELPLGEPAFDVRYMLYGLEHRHALVNGFSGGAPADYVFLSEMLKDALTSPDRAWNALASSAATHVVVHEASYAGDRGPRVTQWLAGRGAREVGVFGADRVFSIR